MTQIIDINGYALFYFESKWSLNTILLCDIFGLKIQLCKYLWQISCVQASQTGQDPGCQVPIADDASTQHCIATITISLISCCWHIKEICISLMCFLFLVERTETVADVKTLLKTLGNLSEAGRCILNHENAGRFSLTLQEMENLPSIYLHQYFLHN